MPIVAVAVAAFSVAGVASAAAAAGGLIALASTAVGAFEIIGAVGATLSAVGAVTGNKGLTQAGMVLGVAGGVGALASDAGLIGGSAASAASNDAADAAAGMGGDSAAAYNAASAASYASISPTGDVTLTGAADNLATGVDATSGLAGDLSSSGGQLIGGDVPGSGTTVQSMNSQAANVDPTYGGVLNSNAPSPGATVDAGATPTPGQAGSAVTGDTGVDNTLTGTAASNQAGNLADLPATDPQAILAGGTTKPLPDDASITDKILGTGGGNGLISSMQSWAKDNPMVSYGLLQGASQFVGGAFSKLTPAQVNALNAQAAANLAGANLTNQQRQNMTGGVPSASYTPRVTGIINTNPTGAGANVTGVPA